MSDKCTDADCSATISFPNKWQPVKGKTTETVSGRCPDCGARYMKTREQGSDDPGTPTLVEVGGI